jgi:ribulose-5-phosphate 4-epimerase/fuculose-1-phosphate aldolase
MDVREQLCEFGRSLYNRGLTHGSTGNLSARLPDGNLLVTPTGCSLGHITPESLSVVTPRGELVSGPQPTKEAPLHQALYSTRGDKAGAVVHLHSCYATALSLLPTDNDRDWLPHLTPYGIMQLGQVRLLPYFMPGSPEIGSAIKGLAGKHSAIMLANHGPVVSAKTLEAAVYASEELEAASKLAYLTRALEPNVLTSEQVNDLVIKYNVEWD